MQDARQPKPPNPKRLFYANVNIIYARTEARIHNQNAANTMLSNCPQKNSKQ